MRTDSKIFTTFKYFIWGLLVLNLMLNFDNDGWGRWELNSQTSTGPQTGRGWFWTPLTLMELFLCTGSCLWRGVISWWEIPFIWPYIWHLSVIKPSSRQLLVTNLTTSKLTQNLNNKSIVEVPHKTPQSQLHTQQQANICSVFVWTKTLHDLCEATNQGIPS